MFEAMKNDEALILLEKERETTQGKLEEYQRKLEWIDDMLNKLRRGNDATVVPPLKQIAVECMKLLGRFTVSQLDAEVRQRYPDADFVEKSLRRPMEAALKSQWLRKVQDNQGNKTQAVWEWVGPK